MDPYLLCIETATERCSVAVAKGKKMLCLREAPGSYQHAAFISVLVDQALEEAGISPASLSGIAVSQGPGSYTALRVGLSAAKGLCYGLQIPLLAIDTLAALARAAAEKVKADLYIPMIDARRMEVYTAVYDSSLRQREAPHALLLDKGCFAGWRGENRQLVFCGNGAGKFRELMQGERDCLFAEVVNSARHLVVPAVEAYEREELQNLAYFSPYYLKPPHITTPKKVL